MITLSDLVMARTGYSQRMGLKLQLLLARKIEKWLLSEHSVVCEVFTKRDEK